MEQRTLSYEATSRSNATPVRELSARDLPEKPPARDRDKNDSKADSADDESGRKLTAGGFIELVKRTAKAFGEDKVGRLAAALAYQTVFSLSPVLVVVLSIASFFAAREEARQAIIGYVANATSPATANVVSEILAATSDVNTGNIFAAVLGIGAILFGASALFATLQASLNSIWGVKPKPDLGIMGVIRARFLSFGMVLGVAFLLLVSLVLTTAITALSADLGARIGAAAFLVQAVNLLLGFAVTVLLFAAIFKVLPDVEIEWRDVWVGAIVTAALFTIGRYALSAYLGGGAIQSAYGSAAALVVLLLWVNYGATILFVGAEFTKAYANMFGSRIEPSPHAMPLMRADRAHEGMEPDSESPGVAPPDSGRRDSRGRLLVPQKVVVAQSPLEARRDAEFSLLVILGGVLVAAWQLLRRDRG